MAQLRDDCFAGDGQLTPLDAALTMLYWRIGGRINQEILKGSRADYGAEIVSTVARQLEQEYGSGFSTKNIRHRAKKVHDELILEKETQLNAQKISP